MPGISRRSLLAASALCTLAAPALAQQPQPSQQTAPAAAPPAAPRFGYDDVVRRARELAAAPFEANPPPLPEQLAKLEYDSYRDIRFKPDRALFSDSPAGFRMHLFHPGFLFKRAVTVNLIRNGIPTPVPYSTGLFDYGRNKFDKPLPVNLGFAGFRLHYPLNDLKVADELISFLGASYFRFLGRGQRYGLSARGLAVGAGDGDEEFPVFREFWVETPDATSDRATVFALLDSASVTGAYQFHIYPAVESVLDVTVTLFTRKAIPKLGMAPLTSMFFSGENDVRRLQEDFRPEVHDSDGLLIHSGSGEWIWRPLRNPPATEISSFATTNLRGFGLMQRDRTFEHYQDLDSEYHLRPSYWVEPREGWGEGRVELVEIPTADETNDNIVAFWNPKVAPEAGQELKFGYRLISLAGRRMHPGGYALNSFQTEARARGSMEPTPQNTRRYIVDFVGGDLPYYLSDPSSVQIVPSVSRGKILRTFLVPNPETKGFRAGIDVQLDPGHTADLRAFLKAGPKALTETWLYPARVG